MPGMLSGKLSCVLTQGVENAAVLDVYIMCWQWNMTWGQFCNLITAAFRPGPAGIKTQSNKKLNHGCQGVITSRRSLKVVCEQIGQEFNGLPTKTVPTP